MATDSISQILPIELLRQGEHGVIHDLDGNEQSVHRLAELGLRPQVELTMIQPGQPYIVRVGDHRLTLRLDPDLQILVQVSH